MDAKTQHFIARAREKHPNTPYKYDKTAYVRAVGKVVITCELHGDFTQTPAHHLSGNGCPSCGRTGKPQVLHPPEAFRLRAAKVHPEGSYSYDHVGQWNTRSRVTITCLVHGDYEQNAFSHLRGNGCRACSATKVGAARRGRPSGLTHTRDQFIAQATAAHRDRYDYTATEYRGTEFKVAIVCREHGVFHCLPGNHYKGSGCPDCGRRQAGLSHRVGFEDFVARSRQIHGDAFVYDAVDYVTMHDDVTLGCATCGQTFRQTPSNHIFGKNGCPRCRHSNLDQAEFVRLCRLAHPSQLYDYSRTVFQGSQLPVTIVCSVPGEFAQTATRHLQGHGCAQCGYVTAADKMRITTAEFVRRAVGVHGDAYQYHDSVYTGSHEPITIQCPKHGPFSQAPANHVHGYGCPKCRRGSRGEALVASTLLALGVDFETQKSFPDLRLVRSLRFDFYMPSLNLLVEYDGKQHYMPIDCWGGEDAFRGQQVRDALKNDYADRHSIILLRIPYTSNDVAAEVEDTVKHLQQSKKRPREETEDGRGAKRAKTADDEPEPHSL